MNLTDERTFFIFFCDDDKTVVVRFRRRSGSNGSRSFLLFDKIPAWIGERLGGGNTFKWFGVNERRLRIDVVYGDKNMLGDAIGYIGDNGINGEFGV